MWLVKSGNAIQKGREAVTLTLSDIYSEFEGWNDTYIRPEKLSGKRPSTKIPSQMASPSLHSVDSESMLYSGGGLFRKTTSVTRNRVLTSQSGDKRQIYDLRSLSSESRHYNV